MMHLCHPFKLFLFAALGLSDLALTWFLLAQNGGGAYERNPVAAWWLARLGWPGLVGFKLGMILLTAAAASVVSRYRPHAAGRLLNFGCAALLAVLLYSGSLVSGVRTDAAHRARIEQTGHDLDRTFAQRNAYAVEFSRLCGDLIARRRTLAEAVAILEGSEYVREGGWAHMMRHHYPGLSTSERLAALLVNQTLLSLEGDRSTSRRLARELDAQFRSRFGRAVPDPPEFWDEAAGEGPG